jgi:hypothetical protein
VCIGWASDVVLTKYQSSTALCWSVSLNVFSLPPKGFALRFSFQFRVSAPTSDVIRPDGRHHREPRALTVRRIPARLHDLDPIMLLMMPDCDPW